MAKAALPEKTRAQCIAEMHDNPDDRINQICRHIANGGDMITLAETWGVSYADMYAFGYSAPHKQKLMDAYNARDEWFKQAILRELRRISLVDLSEIYDENNALKPIAEWPKDVIACVAGVDTLEVKEQGQVIGQMRKVKLFDKIKALEMLGRATNDDFKTVNVKHSGRISHEAFMATTYPVDERTDKDGT